MGSLSAAVETIAGDLKRKALAKQADPTCGSRLGISPRYLGHADPDHSLRCCRGDGSGPGQDLPVVLPEKIWFLTETGNPACEDHPVSSIAMPEVRQRAKRETDTQCTFVDSSWYFLRFCLPRSGQGAGGRTACSNWMPVDQ